MAPYQYLIGPKNAFFVACPVKSENVARAKHSDGAYETQQTVPVGGARVRSQVHG